MNENEKKKAINCRFQPNESDAFFEWLNNQSNMTIAIRNLIYHAVDLYGTADFLAPDTQKEVMRNTFLLENTKDKNSIPNIQVDTINTEKESYKVPSEPVFKERKDKKKLDDIFGSIDEGNLEK